MYQPTMKEMKALQKDYQGIPMSKEINGDMLTPIGVLKALQTVSSHCFLLESVEDSKKWGRYTFLGFEPKMEITCNDGMMNIRSGGKTESFAVQDPAEQLEKIMKEHRMPKLLNMPPFTGGLVGYFSYDYIKYAEPELILDAKEEEEFNDVDLMLFDKIIAFDNVRQRIKIMVTLDAGKLESEYEKGKEEIERIEKLITSGVGTEDSYGKLKTDFSPLFNKAEYCSMVEKAKEHIKEGDIFQVVLSNRLQAEFEGSLLNAYRMLRATNPSPYMFYFKSDELEIAGASPETLVKLEDGKLYTFPLAGTKPRGKDEEEDLRLEKELSEDPKELSEHNMLVDLGRNDLGKISRFGTVKVENHASILRFSHVMHIGSTVSGEIREDKTALDAIRAVLPAGTLSGAPKIRACEIINTLENNRRGIYGGAIGYLDFAGNMDTCIAIRIAYKKKNHVYIRSGAGIVADSIPQKEYEECLNKAKAVINALECTKGGNGDGTFN